MKKVIKIVLPALLLIGGGVAYMTLAGEDPSTISSVDKGFLLSAADARMMDWAEGNLAAEKGSARYQQYGKRMMRDQDKLMQEIKVLAISKKLVLPEVISEEKSEELARLKASNGETFERRFRRMIIKDHKRDIHQFKKAAESTDPEISAFAKRYIAMLEDHLEGARELNR